MKTLFRNSMFQFAPRAFACVVLTAASLSHAVTHKQYSFKGSPDGELPIWSGSLITDNKGHFYGTTVVGGTNGGGTVFEVSASGENILYNFPGSSFDGSQPESGLISDAAGNLYGTTISGGNVQAGTVYELSPGPGGTWTESVLYAFKGNTDGAYPMNALALDKLGNLYGTTYSGGAEFVGTVFELTNSGGVWSENILHSFQRDGIDGQNPNAVVLDSAGNLYGTTLYGGNVNGFGTVFEMSQNNGVWTETVLYNFQYYQGNDDGAYPYAGVTLDESGNLYGTTNYGGSGTDCSPGSCGAVYELQQSNGTWTESVLYSFKAGQDGSFPVAGITLDAAGNLYGTTSFGGGGSCNINGILGCGTVFRLRNSGGGWVEDVFRFNGTNGANPQAGVILDKEGDVVGTTLYGGTGPCQDNLPGCGVVFGLIP
jgi:uncharacterized repeat protein (TIGR03803 family)